MRSYLITRSAGSPHYIWIEVESGGMPYQVCIDNVARINNAIDAEREAAELRAANATLEQRVRELTAEVRNLKQEIYDEAMDATNDLLGD